MIVKTNLLRNSNCWNMSSLKLQRRFVIHRTNRVMEKPSRIVSKKTKKNRKKPKQKKLKKKTKIKMQIRLKTKKMQIHKSFRLS